MSITKIKAAIVVLVVGSGISAAALAATNPDPAATTRTELSVTAPPSAATRAPGPSSGAGPQHDVGDDRGRRSDDPSQSNSGSDNSGHGSSGEHGGDDDD